ncbi:hypothetical protein C8R44DRAFT_886013 [Mycena epipterygia]|nr:hypothetical protein C8R44DRAFT_886013 [Mycena epipterygia]
MKKLTSESPNAVPVYRIARVCDGCQSEERSDAQFSVCKKCNENVSRKVYYCSRPCQVSDWPSHKKICGKALTCAIVKDVTLYTKASLAEAVFLLRRIGPAHNGYARSAALVRQITYLDATSSRDYVFFTPMGPQPVGIPKFLLRLVFRLTVQTAMATGDPGCIAAVMEMLVPALPQQQSAFVHQLVQEYGETGAAAIKLVQAQLSAPSAGEAVTRWENEFLKTESGSRYVDVADKPSEVSSLEVTRRVIKDLREWWPRRSSMTTTILAGRLGVEASTMKKRRPYSMYSDALVLPLPVPRRDLSSSVTHQAAHLLSVTARHLEYRVHGLLLR